MHSPAGGTAGYGNDLPVALGGGAELELIAAPILYRRRLVPSPARPADVDAGGFRS
jgi:hypothetical protein